MEENKIKLNKNGTRFDQPYLITRFGIAFIDLILVAILAIGLQIGFYFTCFDFFGYTDKKNELIDLVDTSGLYVNLDNTYLEIDKAYEDYNERLLHYDEMITDYYSHNLRAIEDNKIEEYNLSKINSSYFELNINNEIVEKENINSEKFLDFYKEEYEKALEYFMSDPTYLVDANDTYLIFVMFGLLSVIISSSIFYIGVPLLNDKKRTIGQMIFKTMPIDFKNELKLTNKLVIFRGVILIVFEYVIPILVFSKFMMLSLLPLFATILLMSFTKKNLSVEEYFSNTMTITLKLGMPKLDGKKEVIEDGEIH